MNRKALLLFGLVLSSLLGLALLADPEAEVEAAGDETKVFRILNLSDGDELDIGPNVVRVVLTGGRLAPNEELRFAATRTINCEILAITSCPGDEVTQLPSRGNMFVFEVRPTDCPEGGAIHLFADLLRDGRGVPEAKAHVCVLPPTFP